MKILLLSLCLTYLLLGVSCEEQSVDESPEKQKNNTYVTISKEELDGYQDVIDELLRVLRKQLEMNNLDFSGIAITKDGEVAEDSEPRKLIRRSLVQQRTNEERNSRGSFSEDRGEDQSYGRQVEADSSSKGRESFFDNPSILNLPELLKRTAHLDILGLPGHPIRRIIGLIRDRIKNKEGTPEEQELNHRLLKRFLEHGKGLLGSLKKI